MFYIFDGDETHIEQTLEAAKIAADEAIAYARDNCDPEWPNTVTDIAVYETDGPADDYAEDGRCILVATECDVLEPEEGSGMDYFCDYTMKPPKAA